MKTFDVTELRRYDIPDEQSHTPRFASMTRWRQLPKGWHMAAFPSWLRVYVQDVNATYKRALAASTVSVQAIPACVAP